MNGRRLYVRVSCDLTVFRDLRVPRDLRVSCDLRVPRESGPGPLF